VTARTSTYPKARFVSAMTLVLGVIAITSVAGRLLLEVLRRSDECQTAIVSAIEWLIWTAMLSSALGLILGVVALVARSDRVRWTVVGMGLAVSVGVLLFVPGVATILCGESAA
jgi:hypothetical protein